jgi:outer membrane lipoprotein-sorting protein
VSPARRALPGALLLGLLALATAARAADLSLEDLMRGMASAPGVVLRFHEVKEVSLLAAPLETRGELYFVPPDRLARITTEPGHAALWVDGDRVRVSDEASGDVIDLAGDPVAKLFVDNFVVLFRGDLGALRERYAVRFTSDGDAWSLTLTPRSAPIDRFIASIELSGRGSVMRSMRMDERDGDRVTTTFEDVDVDHHFSDEEIARLFAPNGTGSVR